jgi:hypothetical protein
MTAETFAAQQSHVAALVFWQARKHDVTMVNWLRAAAELPSALPATSSAGAHRSLRPVGQFGTLQGKHLASLRSWHSQTSKPSCVQFWCR